MNRKHIFMFNPKSWWFTTVLLFVFVTVFSQTKPIKPVAPQEPKNGKLITIRHAKRLVYDSSLGVDARRLIGDVECEHEGAVMRCDSAYLYSDKKLEAFGIKHFAEEYIGVK